VPKVDERFNENRKKIFHPDKCLVGLNWFSPAFDCVLVYNMGVSMDTHRDAHMLISYQSHANLNALTILMFRY